MAELIVLGAVASVLTISRLVVTGLNRVADLYHAPEEVTALRVNNLWHASIFII